MTLTLPIVVGKKYVRRDGKVIEAKPVPDLDSFAWVTDIEPDWDDFQSYEPACVYLYNGRIYYNNNAERDTPLDLVSDYIEPAKGHPHAALMMEFAKDAAETRNPIALWQYRRPGEEWADFEGANVINETGTPGFCGWYPDYAYRRRPTISPDPHAENAAEYAKDMALSDKAWEGWECRDAGTLDDWTELYSHPAWGHDTLYRRKEQS